MENIFGLNFGYPALMAMSVEKKRYSVMRKAYTEKNIKSFVLGLMTGKERLRRMQLVPNKNIIQKIKPWDGKDKKPKVYKDEDL